MTVSKCTIHKCRHFTSHDVVEMGSSNTPSTYLMAQMWAETLKEID